MRDPIIDQPHHPRSDGQHRLLQGRRPGQQACPGGRRARRDNDRRRARVPQADHLLRHHPQAGRNQPCSIPGPELSMDHVALAGRSDLILVAPATADAMAKAACGLAGHALSATLLATRAPVIFAPAMDANMYDNAATQENVARLRSRGAIIAGPAEGRLASGLVGSRADAGALGPRRPRSHGARARRRPLRAQDSRQRREAPRRPSTPCES